MDIYFLGSLSRIFFCNCTVKCLIHLCLGLGFQIHCHCRASGDILRNLGAQERTGMRGTFERLVKVGYGFNILGTVPLVILPMQSGISPIVGACMKDAGLKRCDLGLEKRLISIVIIGKRNQC